MITKQLEFSGVSGWGGKRKGAGRKRVSRKVRHEKRPKVTARTPVLITIRLNDIPISLRSSEGVRIFAKAAAAARRFGLRINHFTLQTNHCHQIAECDSNENLSRGMRSFCTSLAKSLKKLLHGLSYPVLNDRYHVKVLKTPTELKRAIRYVLLNICKHAGLQPHIDRFSSGEFFAHWRELIGFKPFRINAAGDPQLIACLSSPTSWLGSLGWRRGR